MVTNEATHNERLARTVKHQMHQRGEDVKHLAKRAGVTEAALNRSLTGMYDWPLGRVFKVASALGLTGAELIEQAESPADAMAGAA